MNVLEKYVLELYGATQETLGASRLDKFNKSKDNNLRSLPPSKGALIQHAYRASNQAGYLWWQSVEKLNLPEVEELGWELETNGLHLKPTWTLKQSSVIVKDFISTFACRTALCKTCITVHDVDWLVCQCADVAEDALESLFELLSVFYPLCGLS